MQWSMIPPCDFLVLAAVAGEGAVAPATTLGLTEVLALVGFVYGILRVVAAITPNQTDDKWIRKFQGLLKKVNFITGLDLKRGVKKYGPK